MSERNGHRLFAAVYDLVDGVMDRRGLGAMRGRLLADLRGAVLEIGGGTGANLRHYRNLERLVVTEPDPAMARRLRQRLAALALPFPVDVLEVGDLADVPSGSFDAAVSTLVLCTVPDPAAMLADLRRVLKPGGRLVVIEHVRASGVAGRVHDLLTPLQRRWAAGCRLDRRTADLLVAAGFDVAEVRPWTLPIGVPPLGTAIAGVARPLV